VLLRPNGCWPAVVVCEPDDPKLSQRLEWCRGQEGLQLDDEDVNMQVGRDWEVVVNPCDVTVGIKRTVRRLLAGETPNLRKLTIEKLAALGLIVQREHPLHEPPLCYPLHRKEFADKCRELGIEA